DGEVLAEHAHPPAVDGAEAGDDAVGVRPLGQVFPDPVTGQHVELLEASFIEEVLDPLAGGHLAPLVLALNGALRTRLAGLLLAGSQLTDALLHGVVGHARKGTGGRQTFRRARGAAAVALGLP